MSKVVVRSEAPGLGPVTGSGGMLINFIQNNDETLSVMNKVVVITGSSRGLGFGLAKRFLEAGCRVMVNGSSEESTGRAMEGLNLISRPIITMPGQEWAYRVP